MPPPSSNPVPETLGKEKETLELLNEEEVQDEETIDLSENKGKEGKSAEGETDTEGEGEEGESSEEIDELKEIEEELQGPKEEDLELTTPVRRKEILKKYPTLFKDFPYLEKAYYREQQFTEVFPTVNDAKTANQKSEFLDRIDNEVMNGDISTVLGAAKQNNPEAFNRIADNYLQTLRQVDNGAYYHVLGNVIKDTIITMVREARALGEQGAPLQAAANVLNQFIFGSQNFTPPQMLSKQARPEDRQREEDIKRQDQERLNNQFVSVRDDLQQRADNVLIATIDQHIDPKGTMTDYVRQHAVREAHSTLEDLISKDSRFRGLLDRLWDKAFEKGFDKYTTDQIKAAYLSKAKTLLPSVIKKARNDALKGLGRRVSSDVEDQEETPAKRGPITGPKTPTDGRTKVRKPSDIPKGMSTLDFLNSD